MYAVVCSTFPIGTTSVTCTATDASGNSAASASFNVTVLAPWHFTLTLAATDSVNPRTGVVTVAGTVACNRTGELSMFGDITQQIAGRATLSGPFFTQFTCTAPSSTWSATVTAQNGRFKPGKAGLSVSAFGCELTCDSTNLSASVTFIASKG